MKPECVVNLGVLSIHLIASITFSDLIIVAYGSKSEDPRALSPTNKGNRQQANLMLCKSKGGSGRDLKRKRGLKVKTRQRI